MQDVIIELIRRFWPGVIVASILMAVLVWFMAHLNAEPGEKISVLWGMVEYTKGKSQPEPKAGRKDQHTQPALVPTVEKVKAPLPTPPPSEVVSAIRTANPPTIDGNLDEPVWKQAQPLNYAVHPPANDSTKATVTLLWDDRCLYVGFDVNDTQVESSVTTPWDGDSVSTIISNGGRTREYRHSLPNDRLGIVKSAYNLKGRTTLDNSRDRDEGYTVELQIPWSTTPVRGSTTAADFLSVDHDGNPGRLYDDLGNYLFQDLMGWRWEC